MSANRLSLGVVSVAALEHEQALGGFEGDVGVSGTEFSGGGDFGEGFVSAAEVIEGDGREEDGFGIGWIFPGGLFERLEGLFSAALLEMGEASVDQLGRFVGGECGGG